MDITGPVLEETHYYPFGLTMAGISTMAPLKLSNNYKYNSIELNNNEFNDGSGLDLYTAYYRSLDPQIGRWWQTDPRPTAMFSPYASMANNPTIYRDFLGDSIVPESNVKSLDGFHAGEENYIGLDEVTINASGNYGRYTPSYTGASNQGIADGGFKAERKADDSRLYVAGKVIESFGLSMDMTIAGVNGAQKISNTFGGTSFPLQDLGKLTLIKGLTIEGGGKFVVGLGIGITAIDIYENGLNWSNGTDLVMGGVAFIPGVGWVISGVYFIGNIAVEHYTGKSIGEHIGEAFNKLNNDPLFKNTEGVHFPTW